MYRFQRYARRGYVSLKRLGHVRVYLFSRRLRNVDQDRRRLHELTDYRTIVYDHAALHAAQARAGAFNLPPERDLFVASFEHVKLLVERGVIGLEGDKLLTDSYFPTWDPLEFLKNHRPNNALALTSNVTYATIMVVWRANYYHWFIDALPRLYSLAVLKPSEPIVLLIPSDLRPFQVTSLNWCLPPNITVQYVPANTWFSVEKLLFPSFIRLRSNNYVPREYLDFVRNAAFRNVALPAEQGARRRIYISRAGTVKRRVLNEEDVTAMLARHGFESIQAEKLAIDQQVSSFYNAEYIVAPHGAGFTNMLFARQTTILEFMNTPPYRGFRRIASILGHAHHYFFVSQKHRNDDVYVDVAQLEQKLVELGV